MTAALETRASGALEHWVERIATDGFVCLPEFCSREFVGHVLDVSLERSREVREALGGKQIGIGSAAGYDEIVQRSPGRWDIPVSPARFGVEVRRLPWWPLVAAVLGEDAQHSFSGVVFSEPGSPAQYWHIDSPHESVDHLPAHALNVMVALHDIPMEMGPTECARGSHVLTNHLANPRLVHDELVYQHQRTTPQMLVEGTGRGAPEPCVRAMSAGSCLVFDDRLMHRGLANRTGRTRHVGYFSYRAAGYDENTHFEAERSVFENRA